jgi:hypothetical protein
VGLTALSASAQKTAKPATQHEELAMLGRIIGVIEDAGSGYTREALQRCFTVLRDIEKRQYSAHTRWGAHHWCGRAFLDDRDVKRAVRLFEAAQEDAESLSDNERHQTAEFLQQAKEKQQAK